MHSILRHVIHAYLVLSVLAGLPAGASRAVLCVAADGHVAIEAGEGRCVERAAGARAVAATPGDDCCGIEALPEGAGGCVDVPLDQRVLASAQRGAHGATEALAPPACCVSIVASDGLAGASLRRAVAPAAFARLTFPPSRTTILRN